MLKHTVFRKRIVFLMACICLLTALFAHPLYEDVDNYSVSMVTMGLFGKNECQYTHILLNILLGGLARLLPCTDAFALIGRILVFLCFFVLLNIAAKAEDTALLLPCAGLFCLFFSISLSLFTANYGIQAVFFAGTGWLAFLYGVRNKQRLYFFAGLLLLMFGMLWRLFVAFVLVPYILLELVFRFFSSSAGERRRVVLGLLPACVLALLLAGVQALYEHSPIVQDGFEYDHARILLEDYPTKEWEEIAEIGKTQGFTELDYDMARLWFLADTETMDTSLLMKMGEAGKTIQYGFHPAGLSSALDELLCFFEDERKENYTWLAGMFFLLLMIAFSGAPVRYVIQAILSIGGSFVIILYFLMIGRAPLRLLHMVFITQTLYLANILMQACKQGKISKNNAVLWIPYRFFSFALCFLLLFSVGYTLRKDGICQPQTAFFARVKQPCHEEETDFTLWEDWHAGIGHELMKIGQLPSSELLKRNLPAGDWVYGQPYYMDYLRQIGLENPARYLMENENAYFATNDGEFLKEMLAFLTEKAGKEVVAVPAEKKKGVARYALSIALAKEDDMR